MNEWRECSKTMKVVPSRKSTETDPSWMARSGAGSIRMRPHCSAATISRSERIIVTPHRDAGETVPRGPQPPDVASPQSECCHIIHTPTTQTGRASIVYVHYRRLCPVVKETVTS